MKITAMKITYSRDEDDICPRDTKTFILGECFPWDSCPWRLLWTQILQVRNLLKSNFAKLSPIPSLVEIALVSIDPATQQVKTRLGDKSNYRAFQ